MENPDIYSSDDESSKNEDEKNANEESENEESVLDENLEDTEDVDFENASDSDLEEDDDEEEEKIDEEDDIDNIIGEETKNKKEKSKKKPKKKQEEEEEEEEEEEGEVDNENYLQKFDENLKNRIIQDFHPELHHHNYEEIEVLSKVIKDINGVVIDPFHKTLPFLTKYEMAKVVGSRAMQIASGGEPFISLESNMIDSYLIAMEELKQKKIPFIIKRPFPNGNGCEYWKLKDLEILE